MHPFYLRVLQEFDLDGILVEDSEKWEMSF